MFMVLLPPFSGQKETLFSLRPINVEGGNIDVRGYGGVSEGYGGVSDGTVTL